MASSSRESPPEQTPDHSREPFFWLFVIVAVVLAVFAFTSLRDDGGSDASFVAEASSEDAGAAEPTVMPLPTPQPTTVPEVVPATVEAAYSVEAIVLEGTVPAEAVRDGLMAAAVELVGAEAVQNAIEIDGDLSLDRALLVVTGEVDDEEHRTVVLAAFGDLGLDIEDRLVLAGSNQTIAEVISGDPELSQLADFLSAAGVMDQLAQPVEGGLTFFAPDNAAVESLDSIAFDELADAEQLTEVLLYHAVAGRVSASELAGVSALASLQGESIPIEEADGTVTAAGAAITNADIDATNGVVHVVDSVLLQGTLRTEVALNELVTLEPVLFASGSSQILDESFSTLDEAAQILLENPLGRVEIQGHTDSSGRAKANLDLSQARADSVLAYLVDAGVDESRMTAVGYGETELKVDPEESDDDKAANRRIEFRVA